jgi:hypothetical protein
MFLPHPHRRFKMNPLTTPTPTLTTKNILIISITITAVALHLRPLVSQLGSGPHYVARLPHVYKLVYRDSVLRRNTARKNYLWLVFFVAGVRSLVDHLQQIAKMILASEYFIVSFDHRSKGGNVFRTLPPSHHGVCAAALHQPHWVICVNPAASRMPSGGDSFTDRGPWTSVAVLPLLTVRFSYFQSVRSS